MRIILALASLSLGSTVPAQTFVVDVNNGPGTNYTSIQTAVASVPDGSTLIVRAGDYGPVLIDGKGVIILCDPNVRAGGPTRFLTVRNTQPSQIVTVRGLAWLPAPSSQGLWIENTLGPVTYDGVGTLLGTVATDAITVYNAREAAIKNVLVSHYVSRVSGSEVVFEQCNLRGKDGSYSYSTIQPALAALVAVNSRVQLVHSTVFGADGWLQLMKPFPLIVVPGGPAVDLTASSLRVMGSSSHWVLGGTTPSTSSTPSVQLPSIVGTGSSARVHPQITMNPVAAGIALTRPVMPSLLTVSAGPGGTLSAARHGAPNMLCAMALSLRGPSVTPPWSIDPVWLDPASLSVEAFAPTPASGPFVVQKVVPNTPALRGFQLVWQAADFGSNGVEFGNPSPSFVQ